MTSKTRFLRFLAFAALCAPLEAQHSNVYAFVGAVPVSRNAFTYWQGPFVHAGGGGEAALGNRFTLGGEAGALIPLEQYGQSAGLASVGPYFHFLKRGSKIDPFLTGGGAVLVSGGVGALAFYGAGANYWMREKIGIRFEFRDHIWAPEGTAFHFLGYRAGVAFRFGRRSDD